jgi:hypothetical protein
MIYFKDIKGNKAKIIVWAGISVAVLSTVAIIAGTHYFHRYIPAEIVPDIRAAIAARGPDPDARIHQYLEGLYGSLDDPANRERTFEGFFNVNHIQAMQILVSHTPSKYRQADIQAMARWVSDYRQNMSAQEKRALGDYFQSGDGQSVLQSATAQFMTQDAEYRSATVPVITELMTTLNALKK